MNEVNQMLSGTIPTIQPARCACGKKMMPNDYGKPCQKCLDEIYAEDQHDIMIAACQAELLEQSAFWKVVD
jgi:hypothetical protein